MKKHIKTIFVICFLFSISICNSQNLEVVGISKKTSTSPDLSKKFRSYDIYTIDTKKINNYIEEQNKAKNHIELSLNLGEKHIWDINLFNSNLTANDLVVKIATEEGIITKRTIKSKAYEGYTSKDKEIKLTIADNFISGFIDTETERYYIEPLRNLSIEKSRDLFVIYPASSVIIDPNNVCMADKISEKRKSISHNENFTENKSNVSNCHVVPIAIANDNSMYVNHGSDIGDVINQNLAIMNAVNTDYDDAFFRIIIFQIYEIFISTCGNCDPWTNVNNSSQLLNSFSNWGENGGFNNYYAIASLWTDRQFELNSNGNRIIGRAFLDGLCREDRRYNVLTENFSTNLGLLRNLTSHELGHNFDADHNPDPGVGCIMDPGIGIAPGNICWSNQSRTSINGVINAVTQFGGCLLGCNCPNNITVSQELLPGQVDNRIANNQITAINIINDNSTATYDAGNTILLSPGFRARAGATFRTFLEGCTPSKSKTKNDDDQYTEENKQIEKTVTLYPNPTNGFVNIKSNQEIGDIIVSNQFRNIGVQTETKDDNRMIQLNLSNYLSGIYFIQIIFKDGEIITKSVIIR